MTLHPQAEALLATFAGAPPIDLSTMTAADFRAAFNPPKGHGMPVARVEDRSIGDRGIPVRLYYPFEPGPLPMTLFLHGGGFVIGDIDTTDALSRSLALSSSSLVASVDYRLAPETPFPGGLDDAAEALDWIAANADRIGGRADRIAVAGDSSGGNFAAVLAQRSRHAGPTLCHQLLLYPVLDHNFDTDSYRRYAEGYLLTAEMMRWYWRQYLADDADGATVEASPARQGDLRGVPSATIHVAEFDVLRTEAEHYARRLIDAGVDVEFARWPGHIHGFLLQQGTNPDADRAIARAGWSLRAAFQRDELLSAVRT